MTLSRSRPARNPSSSSSRRFFAGAFAPPGRVDFPALPPADESPVGTLTFVSHPGHLTALPRAASGAFRTFSHVGQRTLTAISAFSNREDDDHFSPSLSTAGDKSRDRRGRKGQSVENVDGEWSASAYRSAFDPVHSDPVHSSSVDFFRSR